MSHLPAVRPVPSPTIPRSAAIGCAARSPGLVATGAAALVLAVTFAISTPAAAQYTGPSSIPTSTVKALLDEGKDDQRAVLRGRIVSHDGGNDYTFADDTGRIRAEISAKHFPPGQPIDDQRTVELTGELDRDRDGVEFDVDKLRPL